MAGGNYVKRNVKDAENRSGRGWGKLCTQLGPKLVPFVISRFLAGSSKVETNESNEQMTRV